MQTPIFSLVLDIARAPYTALMEETIGPGRLYICGNPADSYQWVATIVSVATVVGLYFVDHFHDRIGMELL